jgi:hypothetical protein
MNVMHYYHAQHARYHIRHRNIYFVLRSCRTRWLYALCVMSIAVVNGRLVLIFEYVQTRLAPSSILATDTTRFMRAIAGAS